MGASASAEDFFKDSYDDTPPIVESVNLPLSLSIKDPQTGEILNISSPGNNTIKVIKEIIENYEFLVPDLYLEQQLLQNERTLNDYNIRNGTTIFGDLKNGAEEFKRRKMEEEKKRKEEAEYVNKGILVGLNRF
jgi:hypothetical protein